MEKGGGACRRRLPSAVALITQHKLTTRDMQAPVIRNVIHTHTLSLSQHAPVIRDVAAHRRQQHEREEALRQPRVEVGHKHLGRNVAACACERVRAKCAIVEKAMQRRAGCKQQRLLQRLKHDNCAVLLPLFNDSRRVRRPAVRVCQVEHLLPVFEVGDDLERLGHLCDEIGHHISVTKNETHEPRGRRRRRGVGGRRSAGVCAGVCRVCPQPLFDIPLPAGRNVRARTLPVVYRDSSCPTPR